ncbi:MAG TPA: nucleoside deaminase, partial [Longimicrobiales bacterium]|nr:nucleoside deaminase [Longimicrobiales bacterium]
ALRAAAAHLGTHVLEGCTIHCSCEPCPMCLGAIYWARISRVVYACSAADARNAGFDDADIYGEMGRAWTERRIPAEQRLRERGLEPLRSWVANPDRVEY